MNEVYVKTTITKITKEDNEMRQNLIATLTRLSLPKEYIGIDGIYGSSSTFTISTPGTYSVSSSTTGSYLLTVPSSLTYTVGGA